MLMVRISAYCDGSNFVGFGSGAGVYIEWDLLGQKMAPWKQFVVPLHPTNTNNEAEYHAVIAALEAFRDLVASQSLGKVLGCKRTTPSLSSTATLNLSFVK